MFNQLILHIKSFHKFSDQVAAARLDGENNDIPTTSDIEANTGLKNTVEDSGKENTMSYEVCKSMLLDHFRNLNESLSSGFSKND